MRIDLEGLGKAVEQQLALLSDTGNGVAVGWVPVDDIAWNTYGTVTGTDTGRDASTVTGYIIHTHALRGGLGGTGTDQTVVYVSDQPDSDPTTATVVYADPNTVVTVLTPPPGRPAGEASPWTRMPIEHQVVAAGHLLGITVRVIPGDPNPIYQVEDYPPTALSRVADYLLDGGYARSVGRARPLPHPNRLADAHHTRRQS